MCGDNKNNNRRGGAREDFLYYGTQTIFMNREQLKAHFKKLTKRINKTRNK